jgi:hypothetical protein
MERPPHVLLNICAFPHILGSASSYMTLQPLPSGIFFHTRKISFSFLSVCGYDNKIIYLAGLAETSTHSWPGYRYTNL